MAKAAVELPEEDEDERKVVAFQQRVGEVILDREAGDDRRIDISDLAFDQLADWFYWGWIAGATDAGRQNS